MDALTSVYSTTTSICPGEGPNVCTFRMWRGKGRVRMDPGQSERRVAWLCQVVNAVGPRCTASRGWRPPVPPTLGSGTVTERLRVECKRKIIETSPMEWQKWTVPPGLGTGSSMIGRWSLAFYGCSRHRQYQLAKKMAEAAEHRQASRVEKDWRDLGRADRLSRSLHTRNCLP